MANGIDKVKFHYVDVSFYFPKRNMLKSFILQKLQKEGRKVEALNYVFCTDDYLLAINKQYLQHDTLTDIITFELSPKAQPLIADIYISIERVRENTSVFRTAFRNELLRVVFHGILHLIGYKDKSAIDAQVMRNMEELYLRQYSTWNIGRK